MRGNGFTSFATDNWYPGALMSSLSSTADSSSLSQFDSFASSASDCHSTTESHEMGSDNIPPYTPSPPSPNYSTELLPGEQTVQFARHVASRPTGIYRRITDHLTVVLRGQHPGSVHPICGRNGFIQGEITLNLNTADLTSVTLKLEGHLLLHVSSGPVSTTFLSTTYVLWSASHAQRCPHTIAFEVIFPLTFNDGGRTRALPPSFESNEPRVTCSYSLTVELSRPWQFRSLLKGNEALRIPLTYRPRSRPHLPMLPSDLPFLSTVKSSPEEWHQVMCTAKMTQGSKLAPVECLLFIPSVQAYALSDTIPFHLQIRGSPMSLAPFLGPDGRQSTTGQHNGGVVIRIYLLRQTSVRIYGQSVWASCSIGEGELKALQSLPSSHHTLPRPPLNDGMDSLDWDGILRCNEDTTVSGFSTSQISVKDSIVLSITPQQPLKSPLIGVKHLHPIRLVTDPWSDDAPS